MKIGELAAQTGLAASAIRYYERCGLLPPPYRVGGQRQYSQQAVYRLRLIQFTAGMGFSLREIRMFLAGLHDRAPIGPRWRKVAHRRIQELDANIRRARQLRSLLKHLLRCNCGSVQACVERLSLDPTLACISADRKLQRARGSRSPRT
jgi:MerR family transcriptional regulator, redox-sensitive transcriptional activator SoxR